MFGVLFGDIASGRLLRLPYLGYSILLGVLALFVVAALISGLVSQQASGVVNSLVWLALVLIPTGMLGGKSGGLR